ncbi:hypothetical protein Bhz51_00267 [Stenotrophomonas phage vB_SmaM_Bhz51]|nr:hypothetical protein HWC58_gp127 [Stenotrophomonas phage Moby]YP_010077834.1 hypothetical protein KMC40_gp117 [Stenotrophomonas phage IME-SM1]QXN67352.1 hypothetical protein [Stenotrophomonas phage BUCT608]QYW02791.1 hypothetical protein CPT_Marzo_273 [Stenotrophomonas phage Marzo]AKO61641.1 hypothetical protein [Stenotrophomonas phage IME-SM1]QFR57996.1 hypothetical protein CPT_Moby_271 [Stenotrophomonas phage Moby]QYC97490.1 hypothetical protein [Stenotrophomonas phage BUCT608]
MNTYDRTEELMIQARNALSRLQDHLKEVVGSHASIIAEDDQYDDPELWWARPALDDTERCVDILNDAFNDLENNR